MKSEQEITAYRRQLLEGWADFGKNHGHEFTASVMTSEQVHFMGAGAMAMANWILELERPDNLGKLLAAIKKDNDLNQQPRVERGVEGTSAK